MAAEGGGDAAAGRCVPTAARGLVPLDAPRPRAGVLRSLGWMSICGQHGTPIAARIALGEVPRGERRPPRTRPAPLGAAWPIRVCAQGQVWPMHAPAQANSGPAARTTPWAPRAAQNAPTTQPGPALPCRAPADPPRPAPPPRRWYCPYPGCKRSFAELWRLKVHYRAPPDVRGSGRERGHGTELTHCPKCGKGLKPGKHHVGCAAGRTAPRQATKRSRSVSELGGGPSSPRDKGTGCWQGPEGGLPGGGAGRQDGKSSGDWARGITGRRSGSAGQQAAAAGHTLRKGARTQICAAAGMLGAKRVWCCVVAMATPAMHHGGMFLARLSWSAFCPAFSRQALCCPFHGHPMLPRAL
jgi:hypothetical protein